MIAKLIQNIPLLKVDKKLPEGRSGSKLDSTNTIEDSWNIFLLL